MAYLRPPNTVFAGRALKQNPEPIPLDPSGLLPVTLDAQIASKTQLGVVQIGDGISVTPDGVISVSGSSPSCRAINVSTDYIVQSGDYYIGVTAPVSVTIYLPPDPADCIQLIIKADMGAPLGNRKVIVVAQGSATIDDEPSKVLTVPYESINLISQGGNWHVI